MDVTGTPSAYQNNVDSPASQCGAPTPAPNPSPSPAPTEASASNECPSCGGLKSSSCGAYTNCNWRKGSCEAIRRVLRGTSMKE